jgi:hypothetical protein
MRAISNGNRPTASGVRDWDRPLTRATMPLVPDVVDTRGQMTLEKIAAGSKLLWSAAHSLQARCTVRVFLLHLKSCQSRRWIVTSEGSQPDGPRRVEGRTSQFDVFRSWLSSGNVTPRLIGRTGASRLNETHAPTTPAVFPSGSLARGTVLLSPAFALSLAAVEHLVGELPGRRITHGTGRPPRRPPESKEARH